MRNNSLERTIGILLAGGLLVLCGMVVLARSEFASLHATQTFAARSRATIAAIEGVTRAVLDAENGQRGYLLTSQPAYLAPYHTGLASVAQHLAEVDNGVALDSDSRGQVLRLHALAAHKLAELARTVALHAVHDEAAALAIVRRNDGQDTMDELRLVSAALIAREQIHLAQRTAAAEAAQHATLRLVWAALAVLAFVFAGAYLLIRRELRARLAATDALRDSEGKLLAKERWTQGLADGLPALIGYVDRSQTYHFANQHYESFFGAARGSIVGKTMRDVLGEDAHDALSSEIAGALAGQPQTFERLKSRNGRGAHMLVNYLPDSRADGSVAGFYLMVTDITERKNAELKLALGERQLKALTDNVPALVAHLDGEHRYLFANEQFRTLLGADPAAMLGRTLREFRSEAAYAQIAEHMPAVLRGETRRFEVSDLIQGREHHLQQTLVPDVDAAGAVRGYYSVSFDITELRRHEQLLAASEAQHRAIVEEQLELVSLAHADGTLAYVNPAYARHFGRTQDELVGVSLFDFVDPTHHAAVAAQVAEVLRMGEPCSGENRMLAPDGSERWVTWTNTLQRDSAGQALLRSVGRDITEQRRAERALQASEDFLARTGRVAGVGGWQVDLDSSSITWSDETCRIHEVPLGHQPTMEAAIHFYAPEARPVIEAAVQHALATGESWDLELPLLTAKGRRIWVRAVGDVEFQGGRAHRLVGAFQNIDDRKIVELALAEKEHLLRTVTDNLPVLISYIDRDETLRFMNATGQRWLGLNPKTSVGQRVRDVFGAAPYAERRAQLRRALAGERVAFEIEMRTTDGLRHLESTYIPDIRDDASVAGIFTLSTDITAMKATQRQLDELARVDTLTGLPNRRQFDEKLHESLRRSQRDGHRVVVMFLDIDHFKAINDSLGHAGGDAVLREFGQRLKASVRETDVAARLAGDEFVVMLDGLTVPEDAALVAQKIVDAIRVEFELDGLKRRVTTSLGVAFARPAGDTAPALMRRADQALYEAKQAGRDGYRVSDFTLLAAAAVAA